MVSNIFILDLSFANPKSKCGAEVQVLLRYVELAVFWYIVVQKTWSHAKRGPAELTSMPKQPTAKHWNENGRFPDSSKVLQVFFLGGGGGGGVYIKVLTRDVLHIEFC